MYEVIKQLGDRVEHYSYQLAPSERRFKGREDVRAARKWARSLDPGNRMRAARSWVRARKMLRDVLLSNLSSYGTKPALLTLTFADHVGVTQAYRSYTSFVVRLKRVFPRAEIRAVAVIEFQRTGRPHFHVLVWGLPAQSVKKERSTRQLQNLWGRGFVDCVETDGRPHLASYLVKYLSKAQGDNRLAGRKAYSCSRGIKRPTRLSSAKHPAALDYFKEEFEISGTESTVLTKVFHREYSTQWLGRATLIIYTSNLKYV